MPLPRSRNGSTRSDGPRGMPVVRDPDPVPVPKELAERVIDRVLDHLDPDHRVMPIGGTLMTLRAGGRATQTDDVDLVLLVVRDGVPEVPPFDAVVAIADALSDDVAPRKDHTAVQLLLATEAGPVTVELIRGRQPGKGGYFVDRRVLEAAADLATAKDRVLELPLEALAVLKAWAADDKDKLVRAGKDPDGYHRQRGEAFRRDVRALRDEILDRGDEPDAEVLGRLFEVCGKRRTTAIQSIFAEAGWALA